MDTSGWMGLVAQFLGFGVTAVVLFRDYRDKPDLVFPGRSARWPDRENPWGPPARDVIRGAGHDAFLGTMRRQGVYMDPEQQGTGAAIEEGIEVYRRAAAKDWLNQVRLDEQIIADQMRRVREQHDKARERVRLEFTGLLIVALGLIIQSVHDSGWAKLYPWWFADN